MLNTYISNKNNHKLWFFNCLADRVVPSLIPLHHSTGPYTSFICTFSSIINQFYTTSFHFVRGLSKGLSLVIFPSVTLLVIFPSAIHMRQNHSILLLLLYDKKSGLPYKCFTRQCHVFFRMFSFPYC